MDITPNSPPSTTNIPSIESETSREQDLVSASAAPLPALEETSVHSGLSTPQDTPIPPTHYAQMDPYLEYVVEHIICLPPTSVMYHQDEVQSIIDLVTLTKEEIESISGTINGMATQISKRESRLLVHFTWWHQHLSSQMLDNDLPDQAWLDKTKENFAKFRRTKVPAINASGSASSIRSVTISEGDIHGNAVTAFQKSIKLDVNSYPDFKGHLEGWLPFKRKLRAVAATHGIERVIQDHGPLILPGTQDFKLFNMQNNLQRFHPKTSRGPCHPISMRS